MRILIFNWRDWKNPAAGGAEIYTHEIAERWVQHGHSVDLFCAGVDGMPEREVVEGVQIIRRGNRVSVYREARKFYETEGRGRYDVVIDEINTRPFLTPRFVDDAPIVALVHQVAREVWMHEVPLPVALAGRFYFERKWLREYRDIPTLTVSQSSRVSLQRYGLKRITIVPEAISPESVKGIAKESRPTVIFCGRLTQNKRPLHALKAFERVRQALPDAQMWIVGRGPQEDALKRRAGPNAKFFGRISQHEKFELMARAHALVATSVREGWGLVVSEAASVGTATVGYDVAGLRDSISQSNGVLVAPKPKFLADTLIDVLPRWTKAYDEPPATGGVVDWDELAQLILSIIVDRVKLSVIDVRTPIAPQAIGTYSTARQP